MKTTLLTNAHASGALNECMVRFSVHFIATRLQFSTEKDVNITTFIFFFQKVYDQAHRRAGLLWCPERCVVTERVVLSSNHAISLSSIHVMSALIIEGKPGIMIYNVRCEKTRD